MGSLWALTIDENWCVGRMFVCMFDLLKIHSFVLSASFWFVKYSWTLHWRLDFYSYIYMLQ